MELVFPIDLVFGLAKLLQPSPWRITPGSNSRRSSYTARRGESGALGSVLKVEGRVLNGLELRRLDSDLRVRGLVFDKRVVEDRRAGVEGTPRNAGALSGIVPSGSGVFRPLIGIDVGLSFSVPNSFST
jgi:hypothetical protein